MNNQVKLIDADKVFRWAELCVIPVRAEDIRRAYELGLFDPDTPPVPTIKPLDTRHLLFNTIKVMTDKQVEMVAKHFWEVVE